MIPEEQPNQLWHGQDSFCTETASTGAAPTFKVTNIMPDKSYAHTNTSFWHFCLFMPTVSHPLPPMADHPHICMQHRGQRWMATFLHLPTSYTIGHALFGSKSSQMEGKEEYRAYCGNHPLTTTEPITLPVIHELASALSCNLDICCRWPLPTRTRRSVVHVSRK